MSKNKIIDLTDEECDRWEADKTINPRTNRKIKEGSDTYNLLEKIYQKHRGTGEEALVVEKKPKKGKAKKVDPEPIPEVEEQNSIVEIAEEDIINDMETYKFLLNHYGIKATDLKARLNLLLYEIHKTIDAETKI